MISDMIIDSVVERLATLMVFLEESPSPGQPQPETVSSVKSEMMVKIFLKNFTFSPHFS